ncbi:hypothetical protein SAMN05444000_10114 [Shimia gijangensis]|uniref:Uncharacterized protein n=1 Tax=Shimia gijangensis TaxID=1470563 RepID=A0A1M6AQU4_9RHOB|nr:hypothetical protein SAMN05444000_10114 [Shimia gijangensis]
MQVTIEELVLYQKYIAKAIQSRSDGELYIPIFERLEREIEERHLRVDTKSRIAAIAQMS